MLSSKNYIEKIAGQKLMIGFDGYTLNEELKYYIRKLKIGGIILFSRNIKTFQQVKDLISEAQEYSMGHNKSLLFIGVDQEGGCVARFKEKPFTKFSGNPHIKTKSQAEAFAKTTSNELKSLGININFAPVLDIAGDDEALVMRKRAFGNDPFLCAKLGGTIIDVFQKNKLYACAKHFPGIGKTKTDSHLSMPSLDLSYQELKTCELIPFYEAIKKDVAFIMLSHILYRKIDNKYPASLSVKIAKNILRQKLNYDGIVITDDLDMGAVNFDIKKIMERALRAEIDILLICRQSAKIDDAFFYLIEKIKGSRNFLKSAEKSYERICQAKSSL